MENGRLDEIFDVVAKSYLHCTTKAQPSPNGVIVPLIGTTVGVGIRYKAIEPGQNKEIYTNYIGGRLSSASDFETISDISPIKVSNADSYDNAPGSTKPFHNMASGCVTLNDLSSAVVDIKEFNFSGECGPCSP